MSEIVKAVPGDTIVKVTDKVKFKAAYPKDFKGTKYMKEGKVYIVHPLHAERLEKKGLGKVQ